jgi:hypothetical protein
LRIELDGVTILARKYESFDELTDDFIDYEGQHERRVPDYDLGIMLGAVGLYLLKKAIDELIQEACDRRQDRKDNEAARIRNEIEERRHAELLAKTDALVRAVQDVEKARPQEAVLGEDAASVSAFLQWARQEGVQIVVRLDTEAENDLKETFEVLTTDVPGSEVNGAKPELGGDDST